MTYGTLTQHHVAYSNILLMMYQACIRTSTVLKLLATPARQDHNSGYESQFLSPMATQILEMFQERFNTTSHGKLELPVHMSVVSIVRLTNILNKYINLGQPDTVSLIYRALQALQLYPWAVFRIQLLLNANHDVRQWRAIISMDNFKIDDAELRTDPQMVRPNLSALTCEVASAKFE